MSNVAGTIDIVAATKHDLEEQLEAAVTTLQEAAMSAGTHGILVTRHRPGKYSAELSDKVPFGWTREHIHDR